MRRTSLHGRACSKVTLKMEWALVFAVLSLSTTLLLINSVPFGKVNSESNFKYHVVSEHMLCSNGISASLVRRLCVLAYGLGNGKKKK